MLGNVFPATTKADGFQYIMAINLPGHYLLGVVISNDLALSKTACIMRKLIKRNVIKNALNKANGKMTSPKSDSSGMSYQFAEVAYQLWLRSSKLYLGYQHF